MEEKTDKVVGYIEYLGPGGMIGEIVPYTSVEKFKDEILDSLDCGRPVTPVVFSDELDELLQFDSDTYFPWGFRSEMKIRRSMFSVMSPKVHLMPTHGSLSKISKNSSDRL